MMLNKNHIATISSMHINQWTKIKLLTSIWEFFPEAVLVIHRGGPVQSLETQI